MRTGIHIAVLAAWLAAVPISVPPARAHEAAQPVKVAGGLLSAADRKAYGKAFHELDRKRYKRARQHARKAKNALPAKVIRWHQLTSDRPRARFDELARFLDQGVATIPSVSGTRTTIVLDTVLERHGPKFPLATDWQTP